MDLDTRLINAILALPSHKIFSFLNMEKLTPDLFYTCKNEYKYIRKYISKYARVPTRTLVKRRFPNFQFAKVREPVEELVNESLRRSQQNTLAEFINNIDPEDITENLDEYINGVGKLAVELNKFDQASKDHEYKESFNSRFQTYQDRKANLDSVTFTTGIPTMDSSLGGGFIAPQLVVLAGDPKMGKTWWVINMLAANGKNGKVGMLVTPEMDEEEMSFRMDALRYELPHQSLRMGKLTKKQESRWKSRAAKDGMVLHIVDATGDSDFTPSKIEAKIELYKPDYVAIDAAYYMRADGIDLRREETYMDRQRLVKQLKAVCKNKNIPIICIVQMKPDTEKSNLKGESALRGIYGGDHWAQGADIVMRLTGSRAEKYRRLVLLANREGETFKEVLVKYEFDPCPEISAVDDMSEDLEDSEGEDIVEVEI